MPKPKKEYEMRLLEDHGDCFAVGTLEVTKETVLKLFYATKGGTPKDRKEAFAQHFVYSVQGEEAPVEVWEAMETTPSPPRRVRHFSKTPIATVKRSVLDYGQRRDSKYSLKDGHGGLSGPIGHAQIKDLAKRSGVETVPVSTIEEGDDIEEEDEEIARLTGEIAICEEEIMKSRKQAEVDAAVTKRMCQEVEALYNLLKESHRDDPIVKRLKNAGGDYVCFRDHYYGEVGRAFGETPAYLGKVRGQAAAQQNYHAHHNTGINTLLLRTPVRMDFERPRGNIDQGTSPFASTVVAGGAAPPVAPVSADQAAGAQPTEDEAAAVFADPVADIEKMRKMVPDNDIQFLEEQMQGDSEKVLAQCGTCVCHRRSLQTLCPGEWLNDEVIEYYVRLLSKREIQLCAEDTNRETSFFFTPLFMTKLLNKGHAIDQIANQYDYNSVKTWSKKAPGGDIFAFEKLFFPMNHLGNHWVCVVVTVNERRIQFYDSLERDGYAEMLNVAKYLADEHSVKKMIPMDPNIWNLEYAANIPKQNNGFDCGVFTCMYCDFLAGGAPLSFTQDDIDLCRIRMALSILRQHRYAPVLRGDQMEDKEDDDEKVECLGKKPPSTPV